MTTPGIESLKNKFNGDIVTPGDPTYEKAIARWAANAARKAKYVTFPKDNESVSTAIKWAIANKIPLAVRGGGHSTSGASSITDGLVIDLSRYLGEVRVDATKKLAYVGGGALWEAVDNACIEHGFATPGGTVNHTGVGGLILGGGYGFLSGEYGLAIDNLVEVTIVTASGAILKANANENPDLFWAIRGGGGNFGVVTEFVLRIHPQSKTIFGGTIVFPGTMVEKVFGALGKWWAAKPSPKQAALVFVASPPPDKLPIILIVAFYNGTYAEGRESFKFLYELGPSADACQELPYELMNTLQNPMVSPGSNVYMSGASHKGEKSQETALSVLPKLAELHNNSELSYITLFEYVPLEKINSVAPHATAFSARGAESNIMVACNWTNYSEENLEKARTGVTALKQVIASQQEYIFTSSGNEGYSNFETEEKVPPSRSKLAFKDNYPRLQQLKAKYDPDEIFSRWFGIEPAKD